MPRIVACRGNEMAAFTGDRIAEDVRRKMCGVRAAELRSCVAIIAGEADVQRAIEVRRAAVTVVAAIARMIGRRIAMAPFAPFGGRRFPNRCLCTMTGGHCASGRVEQRFRAFVSIVEVSRFQDIPRYTMARLAARGLEATVTPT